MLIVVTHDVLACGSPKVLFGVGDWSPPLLVALEINIAPR